MGTAPPARVTVKTLFEASSIPLSDTNYSLLDTSAALSSNNSIPGLGSPSMGFGSEIDTSSSNDHQRQRRVTSPQYAIIEDCVRQLGPFLFIPPENNHTIGAGGNIHNYLPQGACSCFANNCCSRRPPRCGHLGEVTTNDTEARHNFSDGEHSGFGEFQGCRCAEQCIHGDRLSTANVPEEVHVRQLTRKDNVRVFSSESILGRLDDAGSIRFAPDGTDSSDLDVCEVENNALCKNGRHIRARREGEGIQRRQDGKKSIFPSRHSYFAADSREPLGVHVCEGSRSIINAIVGQALNAR